MKNHHSQFEFRVFLEDTDAGGIVYHAKYLHYLERARTLFFENMGIDHGLMIRSGEGNFVVSKLEICYKKAAQLSDILYIRTRIVKILGASLQCEQTIFKKNNNRAHDNDKIATGMVTLAFVCPKRLCPLRFPASVKEYLNSCIGDDL